MSAAGLTYTVLEEVGEREHGKYCKDVLWGVGGEASYTEHLSSQIVTWCLCSLSPLELLGDVH